MLEVAHAATHNSDGADPMDASVSYYSEKNEMNELVHTLERRDALALVLIEGLADDAPVLDVDVGCAVSLVLPCQSVLHPLSIITLRDCAELRIWIVSAKQN